MGRAPSIAEMEKKEDDVRAYLQKLEGQLEVSAAKYKTQLEQDIHNFYTQNKWTMVNVVSGKNADFMQQSDWSMANVKKIIDAISNAVFGDTTPPDGVKIEKSSDVSKALGEMANLELYIAGKVFEVLSGIVMSFGSASSVQFHSAVKSESLGNGLHLFAAVASNSYKSHDFFNNEEIYEYLYIFEVKYSVGEARQQAGQALTTLYEDAIATFKDSVEDLLSQMESGKITAEQFESQSQEINKLIDQYTKKLADLPSDATS